MRIPNFIILRKYRYWEKFYNSGMSLINISRGEHKTLTYCEEDDLHEYTESVKETILKYFIHKTYRLRLDESHVAALNKLTGGD